MQPNLKDKQEKK